MRADPADVEQAWQLHRRRALDVAYRILGSVADAEDVVQEVYLRLARADIDTIADARGWITAVTSRLSIDRLRSGARRFEYVGPWLPEPLVTSDSSVEDRITLDESVRIALLVVLERLSPAERTAFVLHDVFGLTFDEIASIVGRSSAASRQLASRARRRIADQSRAARFDVSRAEQDLVAERFAAACRTGTLDALLEVLDPEVSGEFDSGGAVPGAPLAPVTGSHAVAAVLAAAFRGTGATFETGEINGEPGVVVKLGRRTIAVIAIHLSNGRIDQLHGIGNPAKLRHLDD